MDAPKSLEDFIKIIRLTPRTVLSEKDRIRIAAVMSFDERRVADIMTSRENMVFVKADEMLGPLTLDRLYKSGYTMFPVINGKETVVGILNTEALNALEVRSLETAKKYMSKEVNYLDMNDSLVKLVEEIKRTDGNYFLVRNNEGEIVGFATTEMLFHYLSL